MNDIFNRARLLVGEKGMERIAQSRVLLFGVGGVGSWCAESLVRSGIAHLTIVDADTVNITNVNRQLMATTRTVGRPKVEALKERLLEINPSAQITPIHALFTPESAAEFHLEDYDYVIDCIDSLKDKTAHGLMWGMMNNGAMQLLNIVFGILISYVSNYFVARWMAVEGGWFNGMCQWLAGVFASHPMAVESVKWRVMLGMECLPIALFMALLGTIPESPRWLVRVGRMEAATGVLERIGYPEVKRTVAEIEESLREVASGASVRLFQRRYLKPILLAFFIAFFNQVSGINAINYYAPRIFDMIFGAGSEMASLAGTMGVGTVNLIFTILAFFVIDKFGRRAMIIGGSALMILMHSLVAWQLSLGDKCNATLAVVGILGFIAFFACSSGAVIWVYISEVFPNAVRAKGQALGCFTHWFMCTIISWAFPVVAEKAGTWAFGFFAFMMLVQVLWAVFFMPETKGGTTEDIEKRLGIE